MTKTIVKLNMAEQADLWDLLKRVCEPAGEVGGRPVCRYIDGYDDAKVAAELGPHAKASHVKFRRLAKYGELAPPPAVAPRADLFNPGQLDELTKQRDALLTRVGDFRAENKELRDGFGRLLESFGDLSKQFEAMLWARPVTARAV